MKFKDFFHLSSQYNNINAPTFREDLAFYKIGPDDRIKIEAIREIMLFEAKNDPKSFALEDVERLESNDIYIFRFLRQHDGHLEASLKTLRKSLRWRKENRINQMSINAVFIPREIADIRAFHVYVRDKNGTPTIYTRAIPMPPKKFRPLVVETAIYFAERVSVKVSQYGRRFGFINDCRDFVFDTSMVDIELIKEMIKLRDIHYPDLYAYVAFYEFPVSLRWLFKLLSPIIPKKTRDKIIFIDKDSIDDIIGLDNVPEYMGGRCKEPYLLDTSAFPTLRDVGESRGYSKSDIDEVYKLYATELKKHEDELAKAGKKLIKLEDLENYFD